MARIREKDKFFYGLSLTGALVILSSTMSKNPVLPMLSKSLGADAGLVAGLIIAASTIPGILLSHIFDRSACFRSMHRVGLRVLHGFLNMIMDVGQAVGPIITGIIVGSVLGYLGGFWFMGLVLVLGSEIFSIMFRTRPSSISKVEHNIRGT